jgi:5-methylcytosine-specific restriction endonuclease McrA
VCVWCEWASMGKRAAYRFGDKVKLAERHPAAGRREVRISKDDFVNWYKSQPDCGAYCGLTFAELKRLKIKRGGCYVSWDIDRVDSARPYERDNLALSCFVCNSAKGEILSEAESRIIGGASVTVKSGQ